MGQTQDFPFDIEDVSELLRLRIRRRCTDGVYTDCPFCGDNRGKMKSTMLKMSGAAIIAVRAAVC